MEDGYIRTQNKNKKNGYRLQITYNLHYSDEIFIDFLYLLEQNSCKNLILHVLARTHSIF